MRRLLSLVVVGVLALTAGCTGSGSAEDRERNKLQNRKAHGPTLEKTNLEEKRRREENPDAIGYLYLMNFGQVVGYYVTRGKISSNGSQGTPEQDIHWTCRSSHGCQPVVVDGPQDDGSYGQSDPGIFFFTVEGVKVVTSLDYVHADQPLPINAPKLNSRR